MGEKSIHKYHSSKQTAIVVNCNGVEKYVGRDYMKKRGFEFTTCLNRAKRFQSESQAHKAAKWLGIEDRCRYIPVIVELRAEM